MDLNIFILYFRKTPLKSSNNVKKFNYINFELLINTKYKLIIFFL